MGVAGLGEGGGDLLVAGHIDLAEDAADLRRDLLALVRHRDRTPRPWRRAAQFARGRLAEARCAAGDDCGNSFDIIVALPLPR